MKTAQEMAILTQESIDKKREASKAAAGLAVEKFIMPTIMERACDGYSYAEIRLDNAIDDRAANAYYVYWTETTGGWTRKKTTKYKVYVQDMVDYLKDLGYTAYFISWSRMILEVKWKDKKKGEK